MNKACITWGTLPVSNITQCDSCQQSGDPLKPCIDSCQTTNFPLCSTWMNKKLRGLFLGSAEVAQHHNTQCFECDLQVLQLFKAHKYWSKQKQPTSFLFTCSFNVTWIRKQSLGELYDTWFSDRMTGTSHWWSAVTVIEQITADTCMMEMNWQWPVQYMATLLLVRQPVYIGWLSHKHVLQACKIHNRNL